ncbi:MAG: antibiotic biosynthesis monooxygenase family protein [Dehalococcoidia bacterium]|nr:antibiotic biosynthesis monooxygenase family protein [Dehalococcoidia bacterium]MDZ4278818.1 antibiotic biosynthesis monooxygenase family protein [Dehalococcoidia bacterium]
MVTIIFRMKAKEGKEDEAVARLRKMAEAVEAQEPETLAYVFHQSKQDPTELVLFEVYTNDDALQRHTRTEHMAELRNGLDAVADLSQVKAERLDRVAGFVRATA